MSKKILIMMYLEGASCIEFAGRIGGNFAIERVVFDVNTVVETLVVQNVEVYVCDVYQKGREIAERNLTDKSKRVPTAKLEELCNAGLDGVFLVGAHAKNGAPNAFYSYTVNEVSWFQYRLNGLELGDIGIAATYFGTFGIPVLFVSGDNGACNEAAGLINGITCAQVKTSRYRNLATCLSSTEAKVLLQEKTSEAVAKISTIQPYTTQKPYVIEVTYSRVDFCDECMRYYISVAERVDALNVRRSLDEIHGINDLRF